MSWNMILETISPPVGFVVECVYLKASAAKVTNPHSKFAVSNFILCEGECVPSCAPLQVVTCVVTPCEAMLPLDVTSCILDPLFSCVSIDMQSPFAVLDSPEIKGAEVQMMDSEVIRAAAVSSIVTPSLKLNSARLFNYLDDSLRQPETLLALNGR